MPNSDAAAALGPRPVGILLAEDDPVARQVLEAVLHAAGYRVTAAADGLEAWNSWSLSGQTIVISDWLMPEVDGLELCRRIRAERRQQYTYFLLQTTRSGKQSYLTAMRAGIDDFVTKPVDPDELLARLGAAERILDLRRELSQLQGLLPICSYCKRIRRDDQEWQQIERYIAARSDAEFSHGICPDCYRRHVEPQLG
jgi:CheY-like chemotaxis protein